MSVKAVSKEAGVSPATVSRVINQNGYVAENKAKLVREAMQRVGYNPPAVRRGRRSHKSRGIHNGTIVFLSVHHYSPEELYQMAALSEVLGGVQNMVRKHGLDLVLAHAPEGKSVPPILSRNKADGVILIGFNKLSADLAKTLNRTPGVWSFRGSIGSQQKVDAQHKLDHVFYDNPQVGVIAADYLIERSHRNLAFAGFYSNNSAIAMRRDTFINRVTEQNLKALVVTPKTSDNLTHQARSIVDQLLAANPWPTGVFVPTDERMLALFNVLRHRGIEPGHDIELIGCNKEPQVMRQMHPRPATIDIKATTIGERAVEQLLQRMRNPDDSSRTEIIINPEVIEGEETGSQKSEAGSQKSEAGSRKSETPPEEKEELVCG